MWSTLGRLGLIAAVTACLAPGSGPLDDADIALSVIPAVAAAGDTVSIVLTTSATGGVGYNLCTGTLEHRGYRDWQPLPSARVCTMELRSLQPGEEARFALSLPGDLAPGEYRYHARVERRGAGAMEDVYTGPFTVR